MKVWWCEEHGQNGWENTECYFYRQCQPARGDCRMVDAQLVIGASGSVRWCAEHRSSADPGDDDPEMCLMAGFVDPHWQTLCRWVVAFVSDSSKAEPPKDPWDYDP